MSEKWSGVFSLTGFVHSGSWHQCGDAWGELVYHVLNRATGRRTLFVKDGNLTKKTPDPFFCLAPSLLPNV